MRSWGNHPYTWWTAALIVSMGAAVTNQLWALGLLIGLTIALVWWLHPDAHAQRTFRGFCYFAALAVLMRLAFAAALGNPFATDVIFTLPQLALPSWLGGLALGGEVTATALTNALREGLRMSAIILAIGAASALTPPIRVLSKLPNALYEVGLAILIAITTVPALAQDVARTQTALKLRGRKHGGLAALTTALTPTVDSSLRKSLTLAASMESRGYGRLRAETPVFTKRANSLAIVALLVFILLLLASMMSVSFQKAFGPVALAGLVGSVAILWATSTGLKPRTNYRPIRWQQSDSLCVLVALSFAAVLWALN